MGWENVDDFHQKIRLLSDADWLQCLNNSSLSNVVNEIYMPTFPPEELQVGVHGHSGRHSILEAWNYYIEVRNYALFCQHEFHPARRLLDFGSGWGRILRPFMRDVHPSNIFGVEPNSARIVTARNHNPYVNFIQSRYLPPLPVASDSVDYIVAWSVFSHIDEFSTRKWFGEFHRILRPGGVLAVTTQRLDFIETCEAIRARKQAGETLSHPWHEALARSFVDVEACKSAFERGEYLHSATSGAIPKLGARYGEAIISPNFVKRELCEGFDFIDYVDNPNRLPQALIVMQKNA
ncbi:class I SAM-dependent methyltransferase [Xanthobacter sediminis]|uniref:class I SAM-dependent methyltransferase n=1 Tax=Xanthobacter sediminis TaxID=3119926 RepID=UPI003727D93D